MSFLIIHFHQSFLTPVLILDSRPHFQSPGTALDVATLKANPGPGSDPLRLWLEVLSDLQYMDVVSSAHGVSICMQGVFSPDDGMLSSPPVFFFFFSVSRDVFFYSVRTYGIIDTAIFRTVVYLGTLQQYTRPEAVGAVGSVVAWYDSSPNSEPALLAGSVRWNVPAGLYCRF